LRATWALVLATLAAVTASSGGAASVGIRAPQSFECPEGVAVISIRSDFTFSPDPVNVPGWGPVCWTNTDVLTHRVALDSGTFDTGDLLPGDSYLFTFNTPGNYGYHDVLYPLMTGTVTVDHAPSQCFWGSQVVTIWSESGLSPSPIGAEIPRSTFCWVNYDDATHRIESDSGLFESGDILPGESYSFSFNTTGTFGYHDGLFPSLTGVVQVFPPQQHRCPTDATAFVDMNLTYGFKPAALIIKSGTTVCWRNVDGWTHTVTSNDGYFDSGEIGLAAMYSYEFDKPGVFKYHDELHQMSGVVYVDTQPPADKPIVVPRVVGLKLTKATARIRRAHGKVGRVKRVRSKRVGRVLGQKPRAGKKLTRGGRVNLVVGRR